MFASAFRFDTTRLHAAFAPRKPRHPLLRVVLGFAGLAVLGVMIVFGVFVGAAMLLAGVGLRLWRQRGRQVRRDASVVEGEYRIVGKPGLPQPR